MKTMSYVNIFASECAYVEAIVSEIESWDETIVRDAFGRVKLDCINPSEWCKSQFAKKSDQKKP
jgi:hypothetical protein